MLNCKELRTFGIRAEKSFFACGGGACRFAGRKEDAISIAKEKLPGRDRGHSPGKLFVVGIGPGGKLDRTRRAEEAIAASQVVAGYARYLEQIADLTGGKQLISSGMTQEVERCGRALECAARGATVALVSSGDAGIYGMAGLALEMAGALATPIRIEIVPGVSAASAAAARLGAPLMLDFAAISLSDLLVPWPAIRRRLEAVAGADLVAALYNPRSKKRTRQIEEAAEIFSAHRPASTPVGIATAVGSDAEQIVLSTLGRFLGCDIGMRSIVIIGNRSSRITRGWFVTPRGYDLARATRPQAEPVAPSQRSRRPRKP